MEEPRLVPDMFLMEGWYSEAPTIDPQAWCNHLGQSLGFPVEVAGDEGAILLALTGFRVTAAEDKQVPALATLLSAANPFDAESKQGALQQSWDFPDAAERLSTGTHSLLASEMLCRGLPYEQRLALIRALTLALVELTHPIALYSASADCFADPERWLDAQRQGFEHYGLFNVRSFNIANDPGAQVMDTLGLRVFGVPDLQVHFRDLDNNALAELLYNTGSYLMEQGAVIEDGHTVTGLNPDTRWPCRHEDSLIGPDRVVLDLRPEDPHAAGARD